MLVSVFAAGWVLFTIAFVIGWSHVHAAACWLSDPDEVLATVVQQ